MAESKRLAAHRANAPAVSAEETNPDILLAGFNEEQMQAITAHLAPKAEMKPKDNCSEDGDDDDSEDGKPATESKKKAEEPDAAASAMGNDRLPFVAAALANDENCKGKDALAMAMLADADYANVNASGLVKLLGKTPATTSASADAGVDNEAAARAAMLAAIEETGNSDINANGGGKPSGAANATAVWDRVIAKMPGSKAQ